MADPRVRLDIDLAALGGNVSRIRDRVSPCRLIGVVKANAYGTGVGPVAETLKNAGVSCFAVADVDEACELASAGLPVLILGALLPGEVEEAVARGFICAVTGYDEALLLSAAAEKLHRPAVCHLKIDTGMGRFGLVADAAIGEIEKILRLPGLQVRGASIVISASVSTLLYIYIVSSIRFRWVGDSWLGVPPPRYMVPTGSADGRIFISLQTASTYLSRSSSPVVE